MPSASSSGARLGRNRVRASVGLGLLTLAAGLAWGGAGSDGDRSRPQPPALDGAVSRRGAAVNRDARAIRTSFSGGRLTASTGEQVTIEVSDSYAPEAVSPQAWADFFAGLLHGEELAQLTVRIVPPAELEASCAPGSL